MLYTLFATRDYSRSTTICGALPRYAVIFSQKEMPMFSDEQIKAMTKRIADAMEKMSIGSFLYWMFQDRASGIFVGIVMMLLSLAITANGARR